MGVYQASPAENLTLFDEGDLERSLVDGAGFPTDDTGFVLLRHWNTEHPRAPSTRRGVGAGGETLPEEGTAPVRVEKKVKRRRKRGGKKKEKRKKGGLQKGEAGGKRERFPAETLLGKLRIALKT